jgi:PncC family amidohydrolase
MESVVTDLLGRRRLTLGVAEPLTGGLVSARLTAVPGKVFRGAIVPAANEGFRELLALPDDLPVSEEATEAMALAVCRVLKTDVGLAVIGTCAAGQGDYPPGTVFLGLAMTGKTQSRRLQFPGDPQRIRQFSAISLLNLLRLNLTHQSG